MYFVLVNDGVEVEKNVSYTPITLKVLNEPKDRRSKMGCIWLAAFFPPKVRNYQAMFTPLAEQFGRLQPGEDGLGVRLPDTDEAGQVHAMIAWFLNDIRGVPNTCMGKHPPCYVGSCVMCVARGVQSGKGMVLPGAVRGLPDDHPLRDDYEKGMFNTLIQYTQ